MWMTNGNNSPDNDGTMTDEEVLIFAEVAVATKMVVAHLFEIPNQPIVFYEDPEQRQRKEDDIIAWTWWHYLNDPTSDAEWLLRCDNFQFLLLIIVNLMSVMLVVLSLNRYLNNNYLKAANDQGKC